MKKNYLFSTALALLISSVSFSQVVNGDFENVKSNFLPSNWGMTFIQQVGFDPETGESFGDEMQYTWCIPSMVYASFEPQSGDYAMEISNAFNITQGVVVPGMATIFSDPEQDSPGWNPGIPVEPTDNISMIGFYYKFMPAGDDIAQARIQVSDSNGIEIGHAFIDISGIHNSFEYVYEPITYTSNATPASIVISFTMAKENSTPTFGSRLIIDNVVTNFAALNLDTNELNAKVTVYPTFVENELNIDTKGLTEGQVAYKVMNTEGKVVKQNVVTENANYIYTMDVSQLSSGLYFIKIDSSLGPITKKFIKK
ncbi:T9SS type A sorting domain-containing protein [Flavobacterium phycosphaerae]|uniref:T9SS type A sorting domain-containing protein n=1 Tax=Flavobacterium phycosphaerae TaxID=2697515 RepID=UPI00138A054F|nr:T9SS type A sorting domain-containing protein [Flavobacterium phycosphaerae]